MFPTIARNIVDSVLGPLDPELCSSQMLDVQFKCWLFKKTTAPIMSPFAFYVKEGQKTLF